MRDLSNTFQDNFKFCCLANQQDPFDPVAERFILVGDQDNFSTSSPSAEQFIFVWDQGEKSLILKLRPYSS